jgi:hypothetical protein
MQIWLLQPKLFAQRFLLKDFYMKIIFKDGCWSFQREKDGTDDSV